MYNSVYEVVLKKGTRTELIEERRMFRSTSRKNAYKYFREFIKRFDEDLSKLGNEVAVWVNLQEIFYDEGPFPRCQIIDQDVIKEDRV